MDAMHISPESRTPMVFEFPELGVEEEVALAKIDNLRKELRHYVAEPRS
jgi:hypothetical protein